MAQKRRSRSQLPPGLHRIAQVAKRTGVSEHALRIWERRYGDLASHRSDSGYRLYTDADVARIRLLEELRKGGYAIGDIAMLPMRELEKLGAAPSAVPPLPGPVAEVARARFLTAIERYDLDEASRVASSAMVAFDPFELVTEVVGPLLSEIGERWWTKKLSIAQEHAASAILRAQLGELLRSARAKVSGPTVVATTPPGELHELGALIASVVAAIAGARVVYLGPNTPPAEIAAAVKAAGAQAAMVSLVHLDREAGKHALADLRKALPREVEVWIGGRAAPPSVKGVTLIPSLGELRDRVTRA